MKLCLCPDLHQKARDLPIMWHRHRCPKCYQIWGAMKEPKPDMFGRFMSGDVVLHFSDGYVNLIDVSGDRLMARYIQLPK